jgi:hypothetical protein
MMRPYTVAHKILAADLENPFKPKRAVVAVRYTDNDTKSLKYLSSQGNAPTADQMVSKLFDLSLKGYFVHEVYASIYNPFREYTIFLNLGFSKSMKSNIDSSVIEVVANTLPH